MVSTGTQTHDRDFRAGRACDGPLPPGSSRARIRKLTDSDIVCLSNLKETGYTVSPELTRNDNMVTSSNFAKLDKTTLQVLGWSSGALDTNTKEEMTGEEGNEKDDKEKENLCTLTKLEFRRLSDQVRDVSMNLKNKFRTSAYQKLYHQQQQIQSIQNQLAQQQQQQQYAETNTNIYRSQLAASLRAFKPKDWTPLKSSDTDTSFFRCKPVSCQAPDRETERRHPVELAFITRPIVSRGPSPSRLCRPRSVPNGTSRPPSGLIRRSDTPTDVRPGNFDTLTPNVLANLISSNSYKTAPRYGDPGPSGEEPLEDKNRKSTSPPKDDDVSTSGIDSTHSAEDISSSSSSSDEDSDYEPSVDRNRDVPDLNLRPEKLDSFVIPDSAKGWRKFDFDVDETDIPPYEFEEVLPESFRDLDFRQIARLKWSWRDQTKERPNDGVTEDIMDRMVELERLQMETEDWEQKRSVQLLKKRQRVASAKGGQKDKRCCNRCLQPACTGDCPEKFVQSEICDMCRQPFCVGNCKDNKYEQRMRQIRNVDDDKPPSGPKTLTSRCKSCQSRHNGKLINANNLVLGRPKSGNITYSRGIASSKPKDMRHIGPDMAINSEVIRDFEKLGMDPYQSCRPSTARVQRPRSRNAAHPGKSFSSQRRDSLTDTDKNIAKLNRKKAKSIRLRRPKTAA
ncbi:uncharacterized protein LOC110464787 isoform X3 [Mizuhopecten yessoensis]|uniref:uncharacterized protein LOC110464787 isoform X3 n=1 Tax=Mizuhopecten yessoensis TaxID=6573 RepID=UPI000B45D7F4|nr:uncharacterized protein LOC110464787 isoform X3 [Mizuhopecten yessoensis]